MSAKMFAADAERDHGTWPDDPRPDVCCGRKPRARAPNGEPVIGNARAWATVWLTGLPLGSSGMCTLTVVGDAPANSQLY